MGDSNDEEEVSLQLHQLIETSQWVEVEEFLLTPLARPTLEERDDEGCLPLHYAAYYGAPWHIVQEMITLAPQALSARTNSDYTPLDYVDFDNDEVVGQGRMSEDEYMANREKTIELLERSEDDIVEGVEEDMLMGNSSIEEDEFLFFKEHLHSEYKRCDVDGDGTVSEPEFRLYLKRFFAARNLAPLSKKDVDAMLRAVDLDGSGSIDFDEFCQMLNMSSQLHDALAKQHWNVARRRIALDPNECCLVDMLGQSPLHYAVFCHAPEEILLRLVIAFPGGLTKERVSDNMTPLEYARSIKAKLGDDFETIEELLKLDPESVYENADTLLLRADYLQHMRSSEETIETRKRQFAEIDEDADGKLSYKEFLKYLKAQASRRHLYIPSDEDVKELIAEVVDSNHDGSISFDEFVKMMESDAKPLHEACAKSRWSAVRDRIHTHPAECAFADTYGQLPLHYACYNNISEEICIRMMCEYPEAATIQRYMDGRTPLDFAKLKNAPEAVIELLSMTKVDINEKKDELLEHADSIMRQAIRGTKKKLSMSVSGHDLSGIKKAIQEMENLGLKNDPDTKVAKSAAAELKEKQEIARKEIEAAKVTTREKMALKAEEKAKLESERARLKANALMTKVVHQIDDDAAHTADEALEAKEKADNLKAQADKLSRGTKSVKDRLKREEQLRIKAEKAQKQAEEEKEMILREKQRVEAEKRNLAKMLKESESLNHNNLGVIESLKRELLLDQKEMSRDSEISEIQNKLAEAQKLEEEARKRMEKSKLATSNRLARVSVLKSQKGKGEEGTALDADSEKATEMLVLAETEYKGFQQQVGSLQKELESLLHERHAHQTKQEDLQFALKKAQSNLQTQKDSMKKSYEAELELRRGSMNLKLEKLQEEHKREIQDLQSKGLAQHSIIVERNTVEPLHKELDGGTYVDVATAGKASQSGNYDGQTTAEMAIRGYRTSKSGFEGSGEYAHTCATHTPWWQVEILPEAQSIKKVSVYGRPGYGHRMCDIKLQFLDITGHMLYELVYANPNCVEAFSASFTTSIENVKVVRVTRVGPLKTTDERLLNLNAVQVFAAISVNEFIRQRSEKAIKKLQHDQERKLVLLESGYEEKLKITSKNNENALKLGLRLQEEMDEIKAKEAAARAEAEEAQIAARAEAEKAQIAALNATKEALALKEKAERLEKEREEQALAASRAEAKVRELAMKDDAMLKKQKEDARKRDEGFERERRALMEGQEKAMRMRRSLQNRLALFQNEMQQEIADMNIELGRLEKQLAKIEEEDEFNVGEKEDRMARKILCTNAIVAVRERVTIKTSAQEQRDTFIGVSGIQADSIAGEASLKEKTQVLRSYSRSIEILIDYTNREIENTLNEYNRAKQQTGGAAIAGPHKQSLSMKVQRLQLHLEDYIAAKSLEMHFLQKQGDAECIEDLKDTLPRVRNMMVDRNLDYYKLEADYFKDCGEGKGNVEAFIDRTRVRTQPHDPVQVIEISKISQGQLDLNSRGTVAIQGLVSIYGRVDKKLEVPKLLLMVPQEAGGTLLQVVCAVDGSVACSFPFDDIHRNEITKVITVVSATAKFVEIISGCASTLYSGIDEYPGKLVRMMSAVADANCVQRSQVVMTSDYNFFKEWFADKNRMDDVKEKMLMVKDHDGRIQWIKKSNKEKWKKIGGKLLSKSAINAMIKLQSMRESDYAGFLEKRGKGSSAFGSTAFKRRYWILKNNTMLYYDADESNWKEHVEKGMLSLVGATITLLGDGRTFTISYSSLPNLRVWVLRAASRMQRAEWERVFAESGVLEDIRESAEDDAALLGAVNGAKGCCVVS